MMAAFAPQSALAAGVILALATGLARKPSALALRLIALTSVVFAMLSVSFSGLPAAYGPILKVDELGRGWMYVIALGALPIALWEDGSDDARTALLLGAVLGMSLLAAAANLPMLFIGLEFMSLPAYLLVARSRPGARSLEAALKYFFAGGVAGALFMLGLALYYADTRGLGGSGALSPLGQAGASLMAAAALFKLGAFPLNWWLPDVYEAAAPEVSGFLSTSMKAAAVLFLMRLCELAPAATFASWLPGVGAVTALMGSVMACRQKGLQRLLAYSSVAHAGLLILGVGAWAASGRSSEGAAALLFYLGAYAFMSNGAFGYIKHTGAHTRADLRGRGASAPVAAAAFTVILFSLGGIPPTGGFLAKLLVLWRAVDARLAWPAALAAVSALVSLSYYLGLTRDLWLEEGSAPEAAGASAGAGLVVACAVGALLLGAAPWVMTSLAGGLK